MDSKSNEGTEKPNKKNAATDYFIVMSKMLREFDGPCVNADGKTQWN